MSETLWARFEIKYTLVNGYEVNGYSVTSSSLFRKVTIREELFIL